MPDNPPAVAKSSGLDPKLASLLTYVLGFITGIIFLAVEKQNQDVRFHAWQAIFFGGFAFLFHLAVTMIQVMVGFGMGLGVMLGLLRVAVGLIFFVFWLICLVKAYRGERYQLPVLGPMALRQLAKETVK